MSFLCIEGLFLRKKYRKRIFLRGKKNSNIFVVLDIPNFLRQTVDAGPNPAYEEKVRVPSPPTHTHTHTHPGSQSMMRSCYLSDL